MAVRRPLVSVIIPCHNAAAYLAEAIESALAQTYPVIEVVVIDDASTDGSYDIAQKYVPRIKLLHNRHNRERAWSRNRAIAESIGEHIALLDADDVWLPQKLARQVAFLDEHPEIGLVYAKAEYIDEKSERVQRRNEYGWPPIDGQMIAPAGESTLLLSWNRIPCLTAVFRRTIFDREGPFDETDWLQGVEDYDLWLRISDHHAIGFIDETLARYRIHDKQTNANQFRMLKLEYRLRRRHILATRKGIEKAMCKHLWTVLAPQIERCAGENLWHLHNYWRAAWGYCWLVVRDPMRPRVMQYCAMCVCKGIVSAMSRLLRVT